jgi:hypothetical protein
LIDKNPPAVNDPAQEIERLVGNALKGELFITQPVICWNSFN